MAWIESHQALEKHPKVLQLSQAMGWSIPETLGNLHRFWWWCLDYAPTGDLRPFEPISLAHGLGLTGAQADKFVPAMLTAHWICPQRGGTKPFRVHDWIEYAGRYLRDTKFRRNPEKMAQVIELYTITCQPTSRRHVRPHGQPTVSRQSAVPDLTLPDLTNQSLTTVGLTPNGAALWADAEMLLEFLNQKTGKHFKPRKPSGEHTTTLKLIHHLLKQQYSTVQIKQVIANRWLKWGTDPKMHEYLRPSTLFRPSNFENYLGELGVNHDV